MKLSVVTLFHDEHHYLDQWLQCVQKIADQIVIISTKEPLSPSIIKRYNITYLHFPQNCDKYSDRWPQSYIRNGLIEMCNNEWILSLDIDETISPLFLDTAEKRINRNSYIKAFALATINFWHDGKVRVDGLWFPDFHYRLFHRSCRYNYGNRHITLTNLPEVRCLSRLVDYPYTMPYYECCILHHKYKQIAKIGNIYRCRNKEVNSLDQYEKGCKTKTLQQIEKMFVYNFTH